MSLNKRQLERVLMLWLLVSLLLMLALPLVSCAVSPLTPTPASIPAVPPLPPQAQQEPLPAWCLPTCSAGWTQMMLRQSAEGQKLLKASTSPMAKGLPASGPTR